jgi:hypothetical protein
MNVLPFAIAFSSSLILSFVCLITFGLLGHKKENGRSYSFLCQFPFELVEGHSPFLLAAQVSAFAFSFCFVLSGTILLWDSAFYPYISLGVALSILSLAKGASLAFLFKVPAYHFKPHMLFSTLYLAFGALMCAFSGIFFLNMRAVDEFPALLLMGAEFALCLCFVFLCLNPKMANWTKLRSEDDGSGALKVTRPRPFVLAFSQWLAIAFDFLCCLVLLFGVSFFSLD